MSHQRQTVILFLVLLGLILTCVVGWLSLRTPQEHGLQASPLDDRREAALEPLRDSLASPLDERGALGHVPVASLDPPRGQPSPGVPTVALEERSEPLRLVDESGAPVAGVRYWSDVKPYLGHWAKPPIGADVTSKDGTLDRPVHAPDQWLWFLLSEGVALAAPPDLIANSTTLEAPTLRDTTIEILGLPDDAHWSLAAHPAVMEPSKDFEHGNHRVDPPHGTSNGVLLHRRAIRRSGTRGPASCLLQLVEHLPYAFYMDAEGYAVAPNILELPSPRNVIATAGRPLPSVTFEILEADGVTPARLPGMAGAGKPERQHAYYGAFTEGGGKVTWVEPGYRLGVVLKDGEVHSRALQRGDISTSDPISFVRGTGQPPQPSPSAPRGWTDANIAILGTQGLQPVTSFEHFYPFTNRRTVASWWRGEKLVVQTTPLGASVIGRLVLIADHGARIGVEDAGAIVHLSAAPLEAVDLAAIIATHDKGGPGSRSIRVNIQIRHPKLAFGGSADWIRLDLLRLHVVEGIGWRLTETNSTDMHEPIGPPRRFFAPEGAEARILLSTSNTEPTTLPLRFEE